MDSKKMKFEVAKLHFSEKRGSQKVSSPFKNKPAPSALLTFNWVLKTHISFNKTLRVQHRIILCKKMYEKIIEFRG